MGLGSASLRELANLEWSKVASDDNMGCVFLCFDSSRDADLARGKVTSEQMMEVATDLETRCVRSPHIRGYLPIALIHHHPFTFETGAETLIQRVLRRVGLSDEYFLRMDDADKFLTWCARRGTQLILHGQKHVPRHVVRYVSGGDSTETSGLDITAVACGSSLGADGLALSYNVLTWDAHSRWWGVSFFSDPGDGSGFARQYVSLQKAA